MLNIFAIKSFTIALFQNILKFREYSLLSKLENFHQHSVLTTIEQVFFTITSCMECLSMRCMFRFPYLYIYSQYRDYQ